MKKLLQSLFILLFVASTALAQDRTVTGTVKDKTDGSPLPGVSVLVKGSKVGTQTDMDGKFTIKLAPGQSALNFTFVGYLAQTVNVGNSSVLNVSLESDSKLLSEVVVVGYGTQKRGEVTGSTASVSGASLASKPITSLDAGLGGRAAGVQITVANGVLNSVPVFRIRGTNSVSLSSQPLIVVDGVVLNTGDYSLTSAAGNALASINPNDIESIDVAKDAAATAIYGSRAANGVVFVTTKKGKTGAPKVSYDTWFGWSNAFRLPELLNASQYVAYKNEAVANSNAIKAGSATQVYALTNGPDGKPIDTKWYDYVYRQGLAKSHNLNVSGGNENTKYYLGAGFTDQQGIFKKNDFIRMNALLNVDSRVNKFLAIGGKLSFSNERNLASVSSGSLAGEAYGSYGLARTAILNSPAVSPYNNDGTYNIGSLYIGQMNNNSQIGLFNPVILLDKNYENNEIDHVISNAYAQLNPFSWLTLKTSYGIDYIGSDNNFFYTPEHGPGQTNSGEATSAYRKFKNTVWTNTAQVDYSLNNNHNFNLLIGHEEQTRSTRGYGINRRKLTDPAYNLIQAGFLENNSSGQSFSDNYLLSYFGRLNYNYKNKYYFSANLRQDEYSALGIKKGVFWGASAGWEITKEAFWEKAGLDNIFSSFKLRGSFGEVGNIGGIGSYDIYSQYSSGLYGGEATLGFSTAGNNKLTWETSTKTDIGFNFGVLKDRITAEFAYYKNDIDGLIINVPQAPSTGMPTSVLQNAGSMYNKGLEFSLNALAVQTKNFSWNTSFNIAYNTNMVTALAPGLSEIIYLTGSGTTGENINRTVPGYSLGYIWVVRSGGVDPYTGRRIFYNGAGRAVTYQHVVPTGGSQWTYLNDGTTAPAITQAADAKMYKNSIPKYVGGFENTFRYKGFDLNALFTYQLGFYIHYGTWAGLRDQRYWNNEVGVLNRWRNPGDITNYVRPIIGDNVSYGNTIPSDFNVFKGDFLKLKSLTLGYTLPKRVLDKAKIGSARVYASGQNLFILTDYPGPDPEVASNGTAAIGQGSDRNGGPNARTFTLGINIGF